MLNILQSALIPPQAAQPQQAPPKLDFAQLAEEKQGERGGMSSAIISIIQRIYKENNGKDKAQMQPSPKAGLNPGWGGEGR